MSTTAATIIKHDPREKPGDGRLNPVHHVVRIVVTNVAVSSSGERHGPGQSHGLTKRDLELGEEALKGMDAVESTNRTSKPSKRTSMFDVLKPTDIVVMGSEPASVRVVDKDDNPVPLDENGQPVPRDESGQPASGGTAAAPDPPTRKLFGHDDRNKDTVLRVWTESDTIEYQCDEPFEIVQVKKAGWEIYDAPDDPFGNSKDGYKAHIRDAEGENEKPLWVWTSGLLPATANNQQYKMTFKIFDKNGENGEEVDPDVVCGDPPPI